MPPVKVNVPELLVEMGYGKSGSQHAKAIGDLMFILTFYYLLCISEYTVKGTVQFKLKDVTFFKKNKAGTLICLPRTAPASVVMSANIATAKLDNQKNGWRGICVHQEANGESFNCPVRALARRVLHLQENKADGKKTFLSAFFSEGARYNESSEDISKALKMSTAILQYPIAWSIPIESIDTHSSRSGDANTLALSGYSDTQIQKMGRWKGNAFKEYI
jgi:hypothetical protein